MAAMRRAERHELARCGGRRGAEEHPRAGVDRAKTIVAVPRTPSGCWAVKLDAARACRLGGGGARDFVNPPCLANGDRLPAVIRTDIQHDASALLQVLDTRCTTRSAEVVSRSRLNRRLTAVRSFVARCCCGAKR